MYRLINAHQHIKMKIGKIKIIVYFSSSSFEPDVVLSSVSVIPIQHRSCSVCMSFVRLGHNNG